MVNLHGGDKSIESTTFFRISASSTS